MKKQYYAILSPDGFDIDREKTGYLKKEIAPALKKFADNYKAQGYYSQTCYNGYVRQIPVDCLSDYCEIITI
jgi:hypothetical protein